MAAFSSAQPTGGSKLPAPWSASPRRTLLTRSASSNRHRFPYPSAAKEVFNIIKRADESGFIEQVCTLLDNALVRSVRQQQPFLFSNNVLAGLEKDSSLLGLIHRLEDGDIEKEDKHMEG
jgi:hypothetical protein